MSTDELIGANLARVRDQRGLSLRKLADRLAGIGKPINADSLNRAEKGRRQVSAGELVALAIVLDVSPLALLLPHTPTGKGVALTPDIDVAWQSAWRWAVGEQPLIRRGEQVDLRDPQVRRFIEENRPFESNSAVEEFGRWVSSRLANGGRRRFVFEVQTEPSGEVKGTMTITAGDEGYDPDGEMRRRPGVTGTITAGDDGQRQ